MRKYKKIWMLSLLFIFIIAAGIVYYASNSKKEEEKEEAEVKELVLYKEKEEETKTENIPVDFEELKKINEDVYAYIEIPGTKVSYPILQSADGSTDYLNRTLEKAEGLPGSIYTENINSRDFREINTVIYGHNMKDGTMFAGLHDFDDEQFFREHTEIKIYLPDQAVSYRIYAAVVFDDRYLPVSYNFDTLSGRQEFLEDIRNYGQQPAYFNEEYAPTDQSLLITLSTCIGDQPSNRWMVIGVRDEQGE